MTTKQNTEIDTHLAVRGITRLPESSYGEHVAYIMIRVSGRKSPIRVSVGRDSLVKARTCFTS
jgi:hypothetical protein